MNPVIIVTDGSADNRTGSGGWATCIRSPLILIEICGFDTGTTSNRMEMTAAIRGLQELTSPTTVELVSDSAYLLNSLKNNWYEQWFEDEILYGSTRPNMDLWRELVDLIDFHNVSLSKVKGHSGDYWNDRVDKLAKYARKQKIESRSELPNFDDDFPIVLGEEASKRFLEIVNGPRTALTDPPLPWSGE